jgi:tetratricopeptide (TPR) repeat protein
MLRGFALGFAGADTALFRFFALIQPLYRFKGYVHRAYALQVCPDSPYRTYDDGEILDRINETIQKANDVGLDFLRYGASVESFITLIKANPLNANDCNRLSDLAYSYLWLGNYQEATIILRRLRSTCQNDDYEWVRNIAADSERLLEIIETGGDVRGVLEANCARSREALGLK